MVVLLGIAFLAGIVTALSPCVLPVLPILLVGGATGTSKRRPLAIVAGLVGSFTIFTLAGTALLDALGLPDDFLRNLAIGLLFLLAATLIFPPVARLVERPFYRLTRRRVNSEGNGFVLGAEPRPRLRAVRRPRVRGRRVALGDGQRRRACRLPDAGVLAWRCAADARDPLRFAEADRRRRLPQARGAARARRGRHRPRGHRARRSQRAGTSASRRSCPATRRRFRTTSRTARSRSVSCTGCAAAARPSAAGQGPDGAELHRHRRLDQHARRQAADPPAAARQGRARRFLDVLVHQLPAHAPAPEGVGRPLPQGRSRHRRRAHAEFAFEHVPSNVRTAVKNLGVRYPVALDNKYATWTAYHNEYWPAEYLIDRTGHIRHTHFGEGQYSETEDQIRQYLGDATQPMTDVADTTPQHFMTPESYLGYGRLDRFPGRVTYDRYALYKFPAQLRAGRPGLLGQLEGARAADRLGAVRAAPPPLRCAEDPPRARRPRERPGRGRREAAEDGARSAASPGSTRWRASRSCAPGCSSCASRRASPATPSRSANWARRGGRSRPSPGVPSRLRP